jgi:hypothetical protein
MSTIAQKRIEVSISVFNRRMNILREMPLLASTLGLLPDELRRLVFEHLTKGQRWEALKAKMGVMIPESRSKWQELEYLNEEGVHPHHFVKHLRFACDFKLIEITCTRDEEVPTVATYVFNLESRNYEFVADDELDELFYVLSSDEE